MARVSAVAMALLLISCRSYRVHATFSEDLTQLAGEIVSRYFSGFRCVTYVSDSSDDDLFWTSGDKPVFLVRFTGNAYLENGLLAESFEQACGGYLVQMENDDGRLAFIRRILASRMKTTGSRYNNQRYLFLPSRENDSDLGWMKSPDVLYLPNLLVVESSGNDSEFALVGSTIFDYHKHHVLGIVHEVLDRWTPYEGFMTQTDLYPDRLVNLMGRPFMFSLLQYSPFAIVMDGNGGPTFDGFETRIAALFVGLMNGTWNAIEKLDLWGEVYPNGTGTGVVGSILSHQTDIGYSAFYQWHCNDVDCTRPMYQSGVTCLTPKPEQVAPWLSIVYPYQEDSWIALAIMYFFNASFILLLMFGFQRRSGSRSLTAFGEDLNRTLFTTFRIHLEQIPKMSHFYEPVAVFLRFGVLYAFFVAAFWQGGIASILTVPRYEKPIDNIQDLLDRWPSVEWGGNSDAWVYSIKASSDPNIVEIVNKFVVQDDDELLERTKHKDFGFFMEELPHGHYGFSDYINEDTMPYLRLMKEKIYKAFGVFILPRGSPFLEKLDGLIIRLFDTGIIHKIENQVGFELINNRLQIMIGSSNEKAVGGQAQGLTVSHIIGSLYIYSIGLGFAVVAFVVEMCSSGICRRA